MTHQSAYREKISTDQTDWLNRITVKKRRIAQHKSDFRGAVSDDLQFVNTSFGALALSKQTKWPISQNNNKALCGVSSGALKGEGLCVYVCFKKCLLYYFTWHTQTHYYSAWLLTAPLRPLRHVNFNSRLGWAVILHRTVSSNSPGTQSFTVGQNSPAKYVQMQ